MRRRHADLPTLWLVTDPRQGETLWDALVQLPRGAGVVFRHHGAPDRRALFERARRIARRRELTIVLGGGDVRQAIAWGADGVHGRTPHRVPSHLLHTAPVHDARELVAMRGADLCFVSPVFATRSHPQARPLGRVRLGLLARFAIDRDRLVALGGMTRQRASGLARLGIRRWAAIDALSRPAREPETQKRKAVPT